MFLESPKLYTLEEYFVKATGFPLWEL